ncbi:hypothetical protein HPB49_011014 [Dermacentor silvarum]|uniref:Uncharacterized protein n=1 Tax=Dermacentor silvarum TaxID=543639 RepID=A0ACB8C363_DERSI|nr:hypothetical protein HPB49_011014 [Dermacentor silvarum]
MERLLRRRKCLRSQLDDILQEAEGSIVHCSNVVVLRTCVEEDTVSEVLSRFWDLQSLGVRADEESLLDSELTLQEFDKNVTKRDGRYQIRLPWKKTVDLADNFSPATKRLGNLMRKLSKDRSLLESLRASGAARKRAAVPHHVSRGGQKTASTGAAKNARLKGTRCKSAVANAAMEPLLSDRNWSASRFLLRGVDIQLVVWRVGWGSAQARGKVPYDVSRGGHKTTSTGAVKNARLSCTRRNARHDVDRGHSGRAEARHHVNRCKKEIKLTKKPALKPPRVTENGRRLSPA